MRGGAIVEVYQSIALKVVSNCCVDAFLGSVVSYQEVCTMFNIPWNGAEIPLREISSISPDISIVSSAI